MSINKVYLLIGGNEGDRVSNLARARELITIECGPIKKMSPLFETAAWGKTDQPSFLNQALALHTRLEPLPLLQKLLAIETTIGRIRAEKYGPRIIDIDILFFNNEIHRSKQLSVPHPEIQNRRFALVPLAAITPSLVHPVLHRSVQKLLEQCPDQLEVKLYEND